MITIWANWTCGALVSGETIEDAESKLVRGEWAGDCTPGTTFGDEPGDLTAFDTGDLLAGSPDLLFVPLHEARARFRKVS